MAQRNPERFNKEQAQAKLGRHVGLVVALPGIPKGTTGCVIDMDEIVQNGFELIIEWDLRDDGKLQHDWFTKEMYEQYMSER